MPRERAFWWVLGSLILVGAAAGILNRRGGDRPLALVAGSASPVPQEKRARFWRARRFELVDRVPAQSGGVFELPTLLRGDSAGSIYVLDSGKPRIVKLAPNGRLVVAFQDVSMGNPTDFTRSSRGQLWVCDPDLRSLSVFDSSGSLLRAMKPEPPIARLAPTPEGGCVATSVAGGPALFHRYSASGENEGSFGRFFEDPLQSARAADGWIVGGSGFFVYFFRNIGLIAAFTWDGTPRYLRTTIAPVPPIQVHIDAAGHPSVDRRAPLASVGGGVWKDELYVLSEIAPGRRILDVYGVDDGSYRYSIRPPEDDARSILLAEGRLYVASHRGVSVWRDSPASVPTRSSVGTP
jgi:hypothetical protein